jgi:hypothetical protein
MARFQRWTPEPWDPTAAQMETALRLSEPLIGARGRTHSDGTAEVRTVEDRKMRRYLISSDGTATLVESRSSTALYGRLKIARPVAGCALIAATVWVVVAQAAHFDQTIPFTLGILFTAMLFLFVSEVIMNRELESSGERWERIGGDDF